MSIISAVSSSESMPLSRLDSAGEDTRTELDSHANMCVFGRDSFIFEWSGKKCTVNPFAESVGQAKDVPICDIAVAYDCPLSFKTYILIARNALYIPDMEHNLIPPFIMRLAGNTVNECPKYQCTDPTEDDHCIIFNDDETDLRIPLQLNGVFSFFHTRKPTDDELQGCEKVMMTPDASSWNPYCPSFELNERSMTTYNGAISAPGQRENNIMIIDDDEDDMSLPNISALQLSDHIDNVSDSAFVCEDDNLDNYGLDSLFATNLNQRAEVSKVMASIGSTNVSNDTLFEEKEAYFGELDNLTAQLTEALGPESVSKVKAAVASVKAGKSQGVSKQKLSKIWVVTEDLAQCAIDHNTQLCKQHADNHLSRNYTTNDRMLRYKRLKSVFYTDTLFALKTKSTRQNTCAQLFVSDKGFVAIYPMRSQSEFNQALHWFCKEVGVPNTMVMDGHSAQVNLKTRRFCNEIGTIMRVLERGTPWSNRAELYIGLLKEAVRRDLRRSDSPMRLWDYCMERRALIHNAIPRKLFQANGLSPHEITHGSQGDISNLCTFDWYEWVYYRNPGSFPQNKERLGRVLGPMKNEGNEMAQAILTSKGTVVPRRTLRPLTTAELVSEVEKKKRSIFDSIIKEKHGDSTVQPTKPPPDGFVTYADDELPDPMTVDDIEEDPVDSDGMSVFEKPITDHLIHAELNLPQGETMQHAKVTGRSKDDTGSTIGTYDHNPMLNTMLYDVEFPDGSVKEYAANIIAENMFSQVDPDGYSHNLLEAILDFKRDGNAIDKSDKYITTKSGNRRLRKSTSGWHLLVLWKNGSEQWIPLSVMKESNPVDVAEFAVSRNLEDESAFCWWVPYTLRKRDRIISAVNARVKRVTHKYGVEIPRTLKEAYDLDEKNGNTFWRDAVTKEMGNLMVAFDILDHGEKLPPAWTKASGHLIFDVRMTLERKARWVKDGHKTPDPDYSTYAGVVSRESVRIALTYAALLSLNVCACDIQNAYLQAPSSEKHYIICGAEFGLENVGKIAKIVRALYGGKSAGADYWRHVRSAMNEMGFESCKADPDVWLRPALKADGTKY
jgi:hypothetical protein